MKKNKSVVETTLKRLFFKVPLDFSLGFVSTTDSELWHIQNPRRIGKLVNKPGKTLAY